MHSSIAFLCKYFVQGLIPAGFINCRLELKAIKLPAVVTIFLLISKANNTFLNPIEAFQSV